LLYAAGARRPRQPRLMYAHAHAPPKPSAATAIRVVDLLPE
jgi:hypothetical protein